MFGFLRKNYRRLALIVIASVGIWVWQSFADNSWGPPPNLSLSAVRVRKSIEDGTITCEPSEPQQQAPIRSTSKLTPKKALETIIHGTSASSPILRRHCMIGPFHEDWKHFEYLIRVGKSPFAVVRYGDGERMLMQGQQISTGTQAGSVDKFWWDGGDSELGQDLVWSLTGHYGEEYYYGFASPIDDADGLVWFLNHTEQTCGYVTYANLWVNSHYVWTRGLLDYLLTTNIDRLVLIANYEGLRRFQSERPDFPSEKLMELPDDAAHVWSGEKRRDLIGNATALANKYAGHVFAVSGGPLAKVLISFMWTANPANQYIDFGSSTDEILKGRQTRPYMDPNTRYAKQVDPAFWVNQRFESGAIGLDTVYSTDQRRLREDVDAGAVHSTDRRELRGGVDADTQQRVIDGVHIFAETSNATLLQLGDIQTQTATVSFVKKL